MTIFLLTPSFLSWRKKNRRCWAFLATDVMLSSHFRFLLIVVSKNRKESTISTVWPLMTRGVVGVFFLLKSITISFVFDTELQVVVPTLVNQPINFTATDCLVCVGDQAFCGSVIWKREYKCTVVVRSAVICEKGVEKWREHTPLRCTSAQDQGLWQKGVDLDHLRSVQEDVEDPLAHPGVDAELSEFAEELVRNDSILRRAVTNEDYAGVGIGRIQMFKDWWRPRDTASSTDLSAL